jgi:ribokinase
MSEAPRVAVVGHVEWVTFTRAHAVPPAGEIVHLCDPLDQPGGGGAVSAMALARMGARVAFFTALAADVPAQAVLEEHGVEVFAAPRPGRQTRVLSVVDSSGERTLFVIGENEHPTAADDLPWDLLAEMDGVYFTGQDPQTLVYARRARVLVVTARRFEALVRSGVRADALVGSARDPGERVDLTRLAEQPQHVIMTEGPRGGTGYDPAPVPGPVVDTYGAGDTFVAGVTFALAAGRPLAEALPFAAREAARALTWRGAFPPPDAGTGGG